jgi:hypothetical protein
MDNMQNCDSYNSNDIHGDVSSSGRLYVFSLCYLNSSSSVRLFYIVVSGVSSTCCISSAIRQLFDWFSSRFIFFFSKLRNIT